MLSKESLRNYVAGVKAQREAEDKVSEAFQQFNPDNSFFFISITDSLQGAIEDILRECIGQDKFEWIMWWIYDVDCGEKTAYLDVTMDENTTVTISSFDILYDTFLKE